VRPALAGRISLPAMRIPPVKPTDLPADATEAFKYFMQDRGKVPRMFQAAGHRPEIMQTMIEHFRAVMEAGTVSLRLKELAVTYVSELNGCKYCYEPHAEAAKKQGCSAEQIESLENFETSAAFSPEEKIILRLARQMTLDSNAIDDAQWQELKSHFDDGQIVELLAVIALFNYFNRFNNALRIE